LSGVRVDGAIPNVWSVDPVWSASDGTYTLAVEAGPGYVLTFNFGGTAGNYLTEYYKDTTDHNAATAVSVPTPGGNTAGIDEHLSPGGIVTGNVTDTTGKPLAGVGVSVRCGSFFCAHGAVTDQTGQYHVDALPTGTYQVEFSATGYVTQWYNAKPDQASADPVSVTQGATTSGINAAMVPVPPTVTSVSPNRGSTSGGAVVTITGSAFSTATSVTFGNTPAAQIHVDSDTQITATTAGAGAGTVDTVVTTAGGTSQRVQADQFTFVPPPVVASVTPNAGPTTGGTPIIISGNRLRAETQILFGQTQAPQVIVLSDQQLLVTVPAHQAGSVDITVMASGIPSDTTPNDQFSFLG
jgi:hypothetical protein